MIIEGNIDPLNAPRYIALKEVDKNSNQSLIFRAKNCKKIMEEDYEMKWVTANSSHSEVKRIIEQQKKNLSGNAPVVKYMVCN